MRVISPLTEIVRHIYVVSEYSCWNGTRQSRLMGRMLSHFNAAPAFSESIFDTSLPLDSLDGLIEESPKTFLRGPGPNGSIPLTQALNDSGIFLAPTDEEGGDVLLSTFSCLLGASQYFRLYLNWYACLWKYGKSENRWRWSHGMSLRVHMQDENRVCCPSIYRRDLSLTYSTPQTYSGTCGNNLRCTLAF